MAIDFVKMNKSHRGQGIQRSKLVVDDAGGFSGNQNLYMTYPMRELLIANDDNSNSLTVTVIGDSNYSVTITLMPGEILDERFYPFTEVDVLATGAWRYIVRSGVIS